MNTSLIKKAAKAVYNPKLVVLRLLTRYGSFVSDKKFLSVVYRLKFGERLNWINPQTFNEKMCWLKVYDRNPLYTKLADKYEVKRFVADTIGNEYVVPCLGQWKTPEDINYDTLPECFVIKGTHDSSGAVICRSKAVLDRKAIADKYKKILRTNYYWKGREWAYKNIQPRIIADAFLDDHTAENTSISLRDYKFLCFNGKPEYMYCTVKDKFIYENFYDMDFKPVMWINHGFTRHIPEFDRPANFNKMVELAGVLSKKCGAAFVRVDFFNVRGKIYFGEFTFYDWGGLKPYASKDIDLRLGRMIKLPE